MGSSRELIARLRSGAYDDAFVYLYPQSTVDACRARYEAAVEAFEAKYGMDRQVVLVSAPGRTEIGGNHTDHQHGKVLAASVDLDVLCVASPNGDNRVRIQSEGYPEDQVDLEDLSPKEEEREKAAALIRGVADWFTQKGYRIGGLDAYTTSQVLSGSGLSSSAAFEVAVGNLFRVLYGSAVSSVEIAKAGKYAENVHFGKPSGLMDQMASSVGGLISIDFAHPEEPAIHRVDCAFSRYGYHLCIVDTRGSHADLTADYAAIPQEMGAISQCFGKEYLRDVDPEEFNANLARLRAIVGDRGVLRAIHFFSENARVPKQVEALEQGDFREFIRLVVQSGQSSSICLQNIYSPANPKAQGLTLALILSRQYLEGSGAWRVHGGGFAGTIQCFVPRELTDAYRERMDQVFGQNACLELRLRPVGGVEVTPDLPNREVERYG